MFIIFPSLLLTFILTTYVRVIHYFIILFLFIFSHILCIFVVNHFKSLVGKSEILINAFKTLTFLAEPNIVCRELSVLHQYMF